MTRTNLVDEIPDVPVHNVPDPLVMRVLHAVLRHRAGATREEVDHLLEQAGINPVYVPRHLFDSTLPTEIVVAIIM